MILSEIKSAPAMPSVNGVLLSRNETEALCLKAARGCGMSWGLAEEAAFAAGWLGAHGIDGAGALLRHLDAVGAAGFDLLRPWPQPGYWRAAPDGVLCPIYLGSSLLDHVGLGNGPLTATLMTDAVSQPVLLAPFLTHAGARLGYAISLSCEGLELSLGAGQPDIPALAVLAKITVARITLSPSASASCPSMPMQPAAISTAVIASLETYALRTTVPATEASRRGAGASSNDND